MRTGVLRLLSKPPIYNRRMFYMKKYKNKLFFTRSTASLPGVRP
jgi:hypothetical protein